MKKQCTKCGKWKELEEFYRLNNQCRECAKEYRRKYRIEHIDEIKETNRKYRAEHIKEIKEYVKKNWYKYADKQKEYGRKYKIEHAEEIKERNRKYCAEHAEEIKKRGKKYYAEHADEAKEYELENRAELKDGYIRNGLNKSYGIKKSQITPEMIQDRREEIMVYRELKQLREAIHE